MSTPDSYQLDCKTQLTAEQIGKVIQLCLTPVIMGSDVKTEVEFRQVQHPEHNDLVAFEVHFTTLHDYCARFQPAVPEPSWFMTNYREGPAWYRFVTIVPVCAPNRTTATAFGLLMQAKLRPIANYAHFMNVDEYLDTELRRIG